MKKTKKETKTGPRSGTIPPRASGFSFTRLGDHSIRAMLGLSAIILVCSWTDRFATAQEEDKEHNFQICQGNFALCAASTCTPTQQKIQVNVPRENTTRLFPEADCTCPIFSGDAIADVVAGNMKGSCQPPGPHAIWSLYALMLRNVPQEINGWVTSGPQAVAPLMSCPASIGQGHQQVNCFSFACDTIRSTPTGVLIATCHCALGESVVATRVPPHTAFITQAGQQNINFCFKHPVAGTISP